MAKAKSFLKECQFCLPPFASWPPAAWRTNAHDVQEIVTHQLGWDITDFGSGNFSKQGLILFTLRNGSLSNPRCVQAKTYAEKIMIVEPGQVTPLHFHWQKMEDIINRRGGRLMVQLYQNTTTDRLSDSQVNVSVDGIVRTVPAGGLLELRPGESVTLPPRVYHAFWGEGGRVLVGEVSMVNDDKSDNHFHEAIGRFPEIIEDEVPLHLLTMDYPRFCGQETK